LGKKVHKTPLNRKGWIGWCMPIIPSTAGSINTRTAVQAGPGEKRDPISKITRAERARGVA
jgi:hypothetical protein